MLINKTLSMNTNKVYKGAKKIYHTNLISNDSFFENVYKLKCIQALKSQNPYELAIVIDKLSGKSIGEFYGVGKSCEFILPNSSNSLILIHGHPRIGEFTLPVSIQDFIVLNNNSNLDKVVAYNINGEQSFLQKSKGYNQLTNNEIDNMKFCYIQFLINNAAKDKKLKIKELISYCKKNENNLFIKQKIAENLDELQYTPENLVNKFWQENAKHYKLEYFCDYSD